MCSFTAHVEAIYGNMASLPLSSTDSRQEKRKLKFCGQNMTVGGYFDLLEIKSCLKQMDETS